MRTLTVSLLGAGRMGKEIMQLLADEPGQWQLGGVWVRPASELLDQSMSRYAGTAGGSVAASSNLQAVLENGEVAVDFSLPEATPDVLDAAVAAAVPLVCGVSGLPPQTHNKMAKAARRIPVFYDRNMSIGIALLRRMVADAGSLLGEEYAVTVHDLHHAQKQDAPSGTALLLGEVIAQAREQDFGNVLRYEPDACAPTRSPGDIRFTVRREGEHPGTHTVEFRSDAELLRLTHAVSDRRVFARGALRAARWLAGKEPGLYGMRDLVADLAPG